MRALRPICILSLMLALLSACIRPVATTTPVAAPTNPATEVPTAEPTAPPSATPAEVEITVFFADTARFAAGTPPFEGQVTRTVPASESLPEAVLREYFKGPTPEERARSLEALTSGFTGFGALRIEDGIARVYLAGPCASQGATYTIAQPIMKNLLQFEGIRYVKIYDADGVTTEPAGETNSIPPCLEP